MDSRQSLDVYTKLLALLSDGKVQERFPNGKTEADALYLQVEDTLPKIIKLFLGELDRELAGIPKILPYPTDFSTTKPFEDLCSFYGRNLADSLRVYFKDIEGGFDSSTVDDRKTVYAKARKYLEDKEGAPKAIDAPSAPPKPVVIQGGGKPKPKDECKECGGTSFSEKTSNSEKNPGKKYWGCDECKKFLRWA